MAAGTLELFLLNKESHEAQAEDNRSRNRNKVIARQMHAIESALT